MINIYRFSNSGFQPQYQKHLEEKSKITLEELLKNCTNTYMQNLIKRSYCLPDKDFEYNGIFVFLEKPTEDDKSFYLNHLNIDLSNIALNTALISPKAFCYIDDGIVQKPENKINIQQAVNLKHNTVYIPESQICHISLNIKNRFKIL